MKLNATVYDASGDVVSPQEYGWFENDIRDVIGSGVWTDANRASRRFANKLAKELSNS